MWKSVAYLFAVLVGIVNCYSVRLAARVQVLTTAIKVAALVIILVGGVVMLFEGIYCLLHICYINNITVYEFLS